MTTESNKNLVVRFVEEFWSKGNLHAADEFMSSDVIIHQPNVGNIEGLKSFNRSLRTAFPDWYSTPEELVAEGDRLVERWTGRGTHRGKFQGISPTSRQVEVPGVVFYRMRGGRIVEFRGSFDMLSLLQQLGAAPSPV